MTEKLGVTTERVDDIPVLVTHQVQMGVPLLLDEHYASHGNHRGLSLGWLAALWLTHILSEADHRLAYVRRWAQQRLETLQRCSGQVVTELDFTDDRLADILQALSDDLRWSTFESALNGNLLRVYDLSPERVRVDATTASGYWTVSEEGLFQFGHSKDHRPDLPQVKVMMSSLDPLGMPVATQVVAGERADDLGDTSGCDERCDADLSVAGIIADDCELFRPLVQQGVQQVDRTARSAETRDENCRSVLYVANSFLDAFNALVDQFGSSSLVLIFALK